MKPAQVDPADALETDADVLATQAADLTRRAQEAQAKAAKATDARTAVESVRRQAFDGRWLAGYDDQAIEAEQRAALAKFEEAVAVDPVMTAWLMVQRLYLRRHADGQMATNFASSVGVPAPKYYPGADSPDLSGAMQRAVEALAGRLEGERTAGIFADREAAAEGVAEGGA